MAAISAQVPLLVIMGLLTASARAAEPSAVEQRAREDLDRQLQEMVKKTPPPEIVISFEGLPGAGTTRGYKLVEADFLVNGQPLAVPGVDKLNGPGMHRLAVLTVEEGSYTLVSHVTYANESWNLFSEESGFLWKLTASVTVQVQRGLRARVRVLPAINPTAPDPRLKLKLSHDVVAEMTAAPADVAIPDVPDAGPPVAVAPSKPLPPPVTAPVATPLPPPVTAPVKTVEAPEQGPVAPAKLLLKVLAGKRPAAATVYVKSASGAPQRVMLDRKARKPVEVMLPPGEYRLDVLAQGYLAQTRKVKLSRDAAAPTVSFTLAKAPVKKSQKLRVNKEVVELPRAPRFAEKQAAPRKGTTAGLALLVDMFVRDEGLRLRIEGHTDNRERPIAAARNALAEARAKAVAKALVEAGLDASRIETVGVGDSRPKAPNLLPRGRELNRRVEFVLLRAK